MVTALQIVCAIGLAIVVLGFWQAFFTEDGLKVQLRELEALEELEALQARVRSKANSAGLTANFPTEDDEILDRQDYERDSM